MSTVLDGLLPYHAWPSNPTLLSKRRIGIGDACDALVVLSLVFDGSRNRSLSVTMHIHDSRPSPEPQERFELIKIHSGGEWGIDLDLAVVERSP